MSDVESGQKSLTVVEQDDNFKLLPQPIKDSIKEIFLPPPPKAGDLSGKATYWTIPFGKLIQKDSGIEGDPRKPGSVVADGAPFPKHFSIVPLAIWYSRIMFAVPGMSIKGLMCKSPDGKKPAGVENPRGVDCFKCRFSSRDGAEEEGKLLKCKPQINIACLTVQDPIGVHILQFKGTSYPIGNMIHRRVTKENKHGNMWSKVFTLSTVKKERDNAFWYAYQIDEIQDTPPEWSILLQEIQKRTTEWVISFIEREKGPPPEQDPFHPATAANASSASDIAPSDAGDSEPVS